MLFNLRNILLLSLAFSVRLYAQTEAPVTLETATGNIEGTLLTASDAEKTPVVLIIAGSGPTDRNGNNPIMTNNSLKMLAEGLQKNGIASLRFDKRGIGESAEAGMDESDLRFEHYVEDVEQWMAMLKSDKRFSEIVVLGHSEGSLIGMIASKNAKADKYISIAGVGVPAGQIIRQQLKAQSPEAVLKEAMPIMDKLENGETVDDIPPMFAALFRPSVQPYMISWFKYDPREEIAKLDIPVLILQGTHDIQVSEDNADKLAEANPKAQKIFAEGMNHILKESEADREKNFATYSMPDLPLKEGLVDTIVAFIGQ